MTMSLRATRTLIRHAFPERQIFFRVRGEIAYVTLPARRQIGLLVLLLGAVGWLSFTSLHYFAFDWMLASGARNADQAWSAYSRTEAKRAKVLTERNALETRVQGVTFRLAVDAVAQEKLVTRLLGRTTGRIARATRVIAMTGLDVARLLRPKRAGAAEARRRVPAIGDELTGRGSPFIPIAYGRGAYGHGAASPLQAKIADLDTALSRWDRLRAVLNRLPLIAPVDQYRLTSTFGPRRDPVNGRMAVHYGLDMADPMGTPVMAPAPGTVVFAGFSGHYGRLIEIDHGFGVRTRYGHLKAFKVVKGQKVGFREVIGLLGNSGRSTGPHVHYEVLVDGRPVNPIKFILAGKYLYKQMARRVVPRRTAQN